MLRAHHAAELDQTRFVDELDLCGQVRVDVAVLNGDLAGYELKSARDTLQRLPTQVAVYSKVLDRASLVVAETHLAHARAIIPEWWGLLVASNVGDKLCLEREREPLLNPAIDPSALVQLLWRDEALAALERRGLDTGLRNKSRALLWRALAKGLPLQELRQLVREQLKDRAGWRPDRPRPRGDA